MISFAILKDCVTSKIVDDWALEWLHPPKDTVGKSFVIKHCIHKRIVANYTFYCLRHFPII